MKSALEESKRSEKLLHKQYDKAIQTQQTITHELDNNRNKYSQNVTALEQQLEKVYEERKVCMYVSMCVCMHVCMYIN